MDAFYYGKTGSLKVLEAGGLQYPASPFSFDFNFAFLLTQGRNFLCPFILLIPTSPLCPSFLTIVRICHTNLKYK
jgi:hypothetical protein